MQRRPLDEQGGELVGVHRGDLRGIELGAESLAKDPWPGEGLLERHLLVEDHTDQKSEGIINQVLVGLGVAGERKALGGLRGARHAWDLRTASRQAC